ncbi:MAG: putative toxin-antitoxin system toxin component, PIN family [Burkholderiales bacterium]|nr:putative toxin-antitoxin system toxin component, PIN family [Burkholderiales bacterium]
MPMRLVLDTNIWLDWLVFDDPAVAPIKESAESGSAEIFITGACEQELERVLAYPLRKAPLPANIQQGCMAQFLRVTRRFDAPALLQDTGAADGKLPRCKDPDDQKFLVLARDCRADWLLTKDRDLLVFARRKYQYLPFRIATPAQFTSALSAA